MTATRCSGEIKLPTVPEACRIACESRVLADVQCTALSVSAEVTGVRKSASSMAVAKLLVAAVESPMGAIKTLLATSRERGLALAKDSKDGIEPSFVAAQENPDLPEELAICIKQASANRRESADALKEAIQAAILFDSAMR